MRKVPLDEFNPDLAAQLVDQGLAHELGVCDKRKVRWRCERGHEWEAIVLNRSHRGDGCPYCSGRLPVVGETDLATTHPELAAQLVDPSLATGLKASSHRKVEWRCEHGHTWSALVSSRALSGTGCPYCSGRRAWPGETDLATTHPELAGQLVDAGLASSLKAGTNRKVEWRCPDCGGVWAASPNSRTHMGSGCPYCAGKARLVGNNDLATTHPGLVRQIVPEDRHLARELGANSSKSVRWRCGLGHEWSASIVSRARVGQGCPYCSGQRVLAGFNDLATRRPDLAAELVHGEDALTLAEFTHKVVEWRCDKGHVWRSSVASRTYGGRTCPECSAAGRSKVEDDFADVVRRLVGGDAVLRNDREVLGGLELDVVVPARRIAFEFNGLYWHSDGAKPDARSMHVRKLRACEGAGYRLVQVWEDDWASRRDVVIRMVAAKLGAFEAASEIVGDELFGRRVMARKTVFREVSSSDARAFMDMVHVQGFVKATRHFGLFDGDDLVACVSLREPGFNGRTSRSEGVWEILRYGSACRVVGGFSKLLTDARRVLCGEGCSVMSWLTFSDNCVSDGGLYETCGFERERDLPPDYRYIGVGCSGRRVPKEQFQKKRFRDDPRLLFDETMTERELAELNGLHRIWDAGKVRWIKAVG